MAANKRKSNRSTARNTGKKSSPRMQKKSIKTKARKAKAPSAMLKKAASPARASRLAPVTKVTKPFTKGQLLTTLAGRTGMHRREVTAFFDELKSIVAAHVKGPGQFTIPGLVKLTVTHKPATKARKGVNPFTGEEMMFKAKPARNVVKARALKQLKEMAK